MQAESVVKRPALSILLALVCYIHITAIVQASTNTQKVFCAVNAVVIILSYVFLLCWASGKKKLVFPAFLLFGLYAIGDQTAYFFTRPLFSVEVHINAFSVFLAILFLILLLLKKYTFVFPVLCILIGCLCVLAVLGVLAIFSGTGTSIFTIISLIAMEIIGQIIICYPYLKIGRKLQQLAL